MILLENVQLMDIVAEINMLNMKTSSNPFVILTKLLKLFSDTCSKCLLHILNNYIFNSIVTKTNRRLYGKLP